jgi:glycosyltransferase involved in cell wall biosynthesis
MSNDRKVKNLKNTYRIAWLLPAMGTGGISFQHILKEFVRDFPETIVYTGQWPGYAVGFENSFQVREVGATKFIELAKTANGYNIGFSYASPSIIGHLIKYKPNVIFANAFTIWTAMAIALKFLFGWKVIIIYEGGSPGTDYRQASLRLRSRRLMVKLADALVVNGRSAKEYIVDVLEAKENCVFFRPFLVPSVRALVQYSEKEKPQIDTKLKQPIFLYVGQIIPRKGVKTLLEACLILQKRGYQDYSLLIVGDGEQRQELEIFANKNNLKDRLKWIGKVPYKYLGFYFQQADIFVFPTYEDIWGMVLTEAMAFGKPVLCSQEAQAVEMVVNGENGFVFDPNQPEKLAEYMIQFLTNPELITQMGNKSKQIMANHTPTNATQSFIQALKFSIN